MTPDYDNRMLQAPMGRDSDPFADIGPTAPSRQQLLRQMRDIKERAQMAMDHLHHGRADVPRALVIRDHIKAALNVRDGAE